MGSAAFAAATKVQVAVVMGGRRTARLGRFGAHLRGLGLHLLRGFLGMHIRTVRKMRLSPYQRPPHCSTQQPRRAVDASPHCSTQQPRRAADTSPHRLVLVLLGCGVFDNSQRSALALVSATARRSAAQCGLLAFQKLLS